MKEKEIIEVFWKNNRISYIYRKDLLHFLKEYYAPELKQSTSKATLIEMTKQYLTENTLRNFSDNIDGFGLLKKDISEIYNVSLNTVNKWIKECPITTNGVHTLKIYGTVDVSIYSISSILKAEQEGKMQTKKIEIPNLPQTDENFGEALYIVNKSAKVSRDTKNKSYNDRKHTVCAQSKTRMLNLYHLKDAVINKLIAEGRMNYLGINKQVISDDKCNYLRLYEIGGFTFHVPCNVGDKIKKSELISSDIDGVISAERKRKVSLNYNQAIYFLEKYCGAKATGTFNQRNIW